MQSIVDSVPSKKLDSVLGKYYDFFLEYHS
jgi:hypothetical protein